MPLTKKEIAVLSDILGKINKGVQFVKDNNTEVLRYNNPINKEIGSDICYLYRAQEALNLFLNPETNP